jgi:hypothetical protein
MKAFSNLILFSITVLLAIPLVASNNLEKNQVVLSGYIKDAQTGELLIGASVYIQELKTGVISNLYGYYACELRSGTYTIQYSFLGYQTVLKEVTIDEDLVVDIELDANTEELQEVVIRSKKLDAHVRDPQMSVQKLQSKAIKAVPALMGEVDVIKVLQLMPGVQATSEGSSGFSVRGGNPDQNLILLDEAIVYNAGHLLGFFSVFNNDAIKDIQLYKGDIPASYGGRLSSLVDVRMNDGNNKEFVVNGGIGLISSRLTVQGPIKKDKTSFILSGRRTYADLFFPLSSDPAVQKSKMHFYDINTKIKHVIDNNNRIYFSSYFGRDVFKETQAQMEYGNQTYTFRWNHVYNPKLFSNVTLINSHYDYSLGTVESASGFIWDSKLKDYSVKVDYNYYLNSNNTIDFGGQTLFHTINPGTAQGTGDDPNYNKIVIPDAHALEHAIYISNTQNIGVRLNLKYGLRYSLFQNIGKGTQYSFNEAYEAVSKTEYKKGELFNNYGGFEPRFGFSYMLTNTTSIKGSYARTCQYMHLATNSTSTTPLDVWFLSSPNIKPQLSDQFSVGYFKNLADNAIETSAEVFYKDMHKAIDFKDHPQLLLNDKMEGEIRVGKAWAYGAEILAKLNTEQVNGWISYTWSRSWRKIPEINDGLRYLSPYNHDHDISVVLNRKIGKRGQLSLNWIYFTGAPITVPIARMYVGGDIIPVYSRRNAENFPDYHRMDISFTLQSRKNVNRKWQGEWNFALYNVYGRKNAWSIFYEQDEVDPYTIRAQKTFLFTYVPSITYNFRF